jgi:signal transduction histidine kinase
MLTQLLVEHREDLIRRARAKVAAWPSQPLTAEDLEAGIPLFLGQLTETLRLERTSAPFPDGSIGKSAAQHGGDLLRKGFTISQVVHQYGDVCQAVTELATERQTAIKAEEFHTFNRCLDTAIAEAVTEYGRLSGEATAHAEVERLGQLGHELRNLLQTSLLAFGALRSGRVGVSGSTGSLLGRSLVSLRALVDDALADVRLAAKTRRTARVSLQHFLEEVSVAGHLHAEYRDVQLTLEPVDPTLQLEVDSQLLSAALMNLLQNAIKYTPAHGQVTLRARRDGQHVFLEVEDRCGGWAENGGDDDAHAPAGTGRSDRAGLGLGLSISRRAAQATGGEIHSRNLPGLGCVFDIELPLAPPEPA